MDSTISRFLILAIEFLKYISLIPVLVYLHGNYNQELRRNAKSRRETSKDNTLSISKKAFPKMYTVRQ